MHDMGGDMKFLAVKPRVGVIGLLVILAIASALAAILVLFVRKSGRGDDTSEKAVANAENTEVGDPTQERLTR